MIFRMAGERDPVPQVTSGHPNGVNGGTGNLARMAEEMSLVRGRVNVSVLPPPPTASG